MPHARNALASNNTGPQPTPSGYRQMVDRQDSLISAEGLSVLGTEGHAEDSKGFTLGAGFTAEQLYSLYMWYPSAQLVDLSSEAQFANGFCTPDGKEVEVEDEDMYEYIQSVSYRDTFGWSGVITDTDYLQAWNPKCNGIGLFVAPYKKMEPTAYDKRGWPTKIKVFNGVDDPEITKQLNGTGRTFFLQRTRKGLPGWMGLSRLAPARDLILCQNKIVAEYGFYAALKGRNHRFVRNPDDTADEAKHNLLRNKFLAMEESGYDTMILGSSFRPNDDIVDKNSMEGSYDPIPMLSYTDQLLGRAFHVPLGFMNGQDLDPSTWARWFTYIQQEQKWTLIQMRPLFQRMKYPKKIRFKDPAQLTPEQKAAFIKDITASLAVIQTDMEDILRVINLYSGFTLKRNPEQYKQDKAIQGQVQSPQLPNDGGVASGKNVGGKTSNPAKPPAMPVKDKEKGD